MLDYHSCDDSNNNNKQQLLLRSGGLEARSMERSEQVKRGYDKLFEKLGIKVMTSSSSGSVGEGGDVEMK